MHEGVAAFLIFGGFILTALMIAATALTTIQIIEADWITNTKNERGLTI